MTIHLGGGTATAVASVLVVVLGFLARKGWKLNVLATQAFVDVLGTDKIPSLRTHVSTLHDQVTALRREVHPNHGKSLGEAVNDIREMATEAKDKAADAASEVEAMSGALARFHLDARARADVAGLERRGVQEQLDVLLRSLAEFAADGYQKERAYVAALHRLGIDLTSVTAELEGEGQGGDTG